MVKVNKKYISAKNNPLLSLQEEGECSITLKNIQLSTNKHFFQKFFKVGEILLNSFPFKECENLIEDGCGVVTLIIYSAKKYNNKVVAVDINLYAISLFRQNSIQNNVTQNVDV
ncbi:methyltransferase [Enterobacter roggenkampii]